LQPPARAKEITVTTKPKPKPRKKTVVSVELSAIERPKRDALEAATLGENELRTLVEHYYQSQDFRKASNNQTRAIDQGADEGAPSHQTLDWLNKQFETIEVVIRAALDVYGEHHPKAQWLRGVVGIGPVIAAGLIANIELQPWSCKRTERKQKACKPDAPCTPDCGRTQINSVGAIWRFAGLDPTSQWGKGEVRPWNARLKVLCWKIGDSFVKLSNHPECYYGAVYKKRKAYEIERNEAGGNAEAAAAKLKQFNIGKSTDAYKSYSVGKLPPAHIDARARRYAVKLFLAHMFEVWYELEFGKKPPLPYPIAHMGHKDYVPPPGF
jgi:hypothetical protein